MKRDRIIDINIDPGTGQRLPADRFNMKKHMQGMPRRPGAFDYLDIPSHMGDERVPHKTNLLGLVE